MKKINLIYIAGGILLAIVGNLVWYVLTLLFPLIASFTTELLMSISSKYTDSIYQGIGLANKEAFSSTILIFVGFIILISPWILFTETMFRRKKYEDRFKNFLSKIENPTADQKEEKPSLQDEIVSIKKTFLKTRRLQTLFLLYTVALSLTLISSLFSIFYQHSLVLAMERNIQIVSPFIDDHQCKEYKSRFRLVDSKELYDKLSRDISKLASENGIDLPTTH